MLAIGCGDPGFQYRARNDSDRPVIVSADVYDVLVLPGQAGLVVGTIGIYKGDIVVMAADCTRLATLPATTQHGVIVIPPEGAPVLVAEDPIDPGRQLPSTDQCLDAVFAPTPPPAGDPAVGEGTILFRGGRDAKLWIVAADGTDLTSLTPQTGSNDEAIWSPDGRSVTFVRFRPDGHSTDVWSVEPASGKETLLRKRAWAPAWAPDGRTLAFLDGEPASETGPLVLLDVATRTETVVAPDVGFPVWSPDGDRVAFIRLPTEGFAGFGRLFVVDVPSGEQTELTSADVRGGGFAWSPDGHSIAFVSLATADESRIVLIDTDNGNVTPVGPEDIVAWSPDWAPDGRRMAFVGGVGAGAVIHTLDIANGEVRRLTDPPEFGADDWPRWSPDGSRIFFVRNQEEFGDLYVVRSDGTGLFKLAEGVDQPIWGPGT